MMVMPAQNLSGLVHYFAGKYPGQIGLLYSPNGFPSRTGYPPYYLPYAIDNGAFTDWQPKLFEKLLMETRVLKRPLWVVVPDVVGDAEATLKLWHKWASVVASFNCPLAFACQDGMEPQDVPKEAHCCFIGGTTKWKLKNAHKFKGVRPLLHIGRVNTYNRLKWAERIGADSVDGTGFFRDGKDGLRVQALIHYFEGHPQRGLPFTDRIQPENPEKKSNDSSLF
jgi:hypothetical protein